MKIGVSLKLNISKIEAQRLFAGKEGASYLDATVFIDISPPNEYGDHGMITQDVTKAEKDTGIKGPILGNAKVFWCDDSSATFQAVPLANLIPAAPAPPSAPAPMAAPAPQAPVNYAQDLVNYQQCASPEASQALWATFNQQQQAYIADALK